MQTSWEIHNNICHPIRTNVYRLKVRLRRWLGITQSEHTAMVINSRMSEVEKQLREASATMLDAHFKGHSLVIVASKLNGGYVKIINADFESLSHIRDWAKHAVPYAIDCPPQMRDIFKY